MVQSRVFVVFSQDFFTHFFGELAKLRRWRYLELVNFSVTFYANFILSRVGFVFLFLKTVHYESQQCWKHQKNKTPSPRKRRERKERNLCKRKRKLWTKNLDFKISRIFSLLSRNQTFWAKLTLKKHTIYCMMYIALWSKSLHLQMFILLWKMLILVRLY